MNEIQTILLSDMPLLISPDGYRQMMVTAFPMHAPAVKDKADIPKNSQFFFVSKTYAEETKEALKNIRQMIKTAAAMQHIDDELSLVGYDFDSPELPDNSVAYHRVWGLITADSRWYFSSKQLEADLLAAEANPQITSHLLHINSPGGEAYYLDRLSETMQRLQKPVIALYEQACSAAYRIACNAQRIYATTKFDFVGCIGTMISFHDFEPYYESLGIKLVEAKATGSDLKNKMFDDLKDGKPKQYIETVLNPLNDDFLKNVKSRRNKLTDLEDDAPVFRGETFFTDDAVEIGLADGMSTLLNAAVEASDLGRKWAEVTRKKNSIYQAI